MPGSGEINEEYFNKAFARWEMLKGAGAGESEILDLYSSRFSTKLCHDLFVEAQAEGLDSLPKDLVEIYDKVEQMEGREPSVMPTASSLIYRSKVARALGVQPDTTQYYVLASAVDEDYPADSQEILPCLLVKASDTGASVILTDGAYSGTIFIVPREAVSSVDEAKMREISGGMF